MTRSALDTGTMWVGTRRGRVFITQNADAEPASAVTYTRIDTPAQPTRFVSGISVDPADKFHAIVSFTGYAAYTPGQPGHVFDVRFNPGTGTATWTDLTSNLGDQPVTDVAYDGVTGDIYAATDFGVDRLPQGSTTWESAATRPVRRSGVRADAPAAAERRALPLRRHARPRRVAPRPAEGEVAL